MGSRPPSGKVPGGLAASLGAGAADARGGGSPAWPGDGRGLPLHPLVEDVLRWRLRQDVPVGYGLDGRVVPRGRPAGRADPRRSDGLADVVENPRHRGGLRDEGADAPIGAAARADQGQGLEQACGQHGPQVVGRGPAAWRHGSGW